VGQNVRVLMPEPHHSRHDEYLENYRRTGQTHILGRTREFQVRKKDGTLVDCELSVSRADVVGQGAPVFTGSFRDVSERKQWERALRESEARFHVLFDRSYEYIGLLKPDGTVLEANQAALDAAGIDREDAVGRKFWDTHWWAVSEEAQEQLREAVRRAAAGEFVRFETVHRGIGDEVLNIDFSLQPVRDDSGAVVLLIPEGRNVTELKRAQRTETAMLRALATIGESAAVLAHEIKNPITGLNAALRAVAQQLGESEQEILGDLVRRMQRLERTVRRTLSFTKPLDLRKRTFDAETLIERLLRELEPALAEAGVEGAAEAAPGSVLLCADAPLVEELLTNLVLNARDALAGHAGPRRIVLSAQQTSDGGVRLAVEDSGPGIAPSLRLTLFKPFVTSKAEGTGLGLAFCKKIVEEHGGRIAVDESRLGGARFVAHFPPQS
jgi:PAS domain S-box-containing protein